MKRIITLFLIACSTILGGCEVSLGTATRIDKEFADVNNIDLSVLMEIGGLRVNESPDEKIYITYYEYDLLRYDVTKSINQLELKQFIHDDIWGTENPLGVTILIPAQFNGTLATSMSAGDITVENVLANTNNIDIAVNAGNINVVNSSTTNNMVLAVDAGSINLTNISANDINLSVDLGNIRGSIKGNRTDFSITSKTTLGGNNLRPNTSGGSKILNANIDLGDIDISFRP